MNPYAPYLLASLNVTERTRELYPLGDVQDVQASEQDGRLFVFVLTKEDDAVHAALSKHRSFLRMEPNEQNPQFVTYVFGVPQEHRHLVKECLTQPDYPQ